MEEWEGKKRFKKNHSLEEERKKENGKETDG